MVNYSKFLSDPHYRGSSYKDLIQHFMTVCLSTKKGKILIALWATGVVGKMCLILILNLQK